MKQVAKTINTFECMNKFPDEASAVAFVEKQIWGEKPVCPHCKATNSTPRPKRHGHRCKNCLKDFTVRIGTIFETSRLPLRKWLYAIYLTQTSRKGISSLQLSKEISIQQRSAWFMLHRIREACTGINITLEGVVEVDETYISSKEANKHINKKTQHSQGGANKAIVFGMKQRQGGVKAQVISDTKSKTLQGVLSDNVAPDTLLCTDELKGYKGTNYDRVEANTALKSM